MRLSSLADYAIVILSAAARRCGARGRLNATMLAEETGIPLPTVQKLVSKLSGAGLIETLRGTGGGLRLARPPATINLADIIEAVEGPIAMTTCLEQGRAECCIEENCRVKPHWSIVNSAVRDALAAVSLASLSSFPAAGPALGGAHIAPGHRRAGAEVLN
ncbi:SUF system Fe-S cluster assembly regulator [Hephaestia sp. GCM10023244]|uniref:SUF system Fe-S cluster assembly regulator n=1 Tax=unclassified Hephaestia TaxID=2631281 RepID=UPI002076EED8|nr:SUF system Fe-S cluster assembly regulator [Hephaestia sp. MAHUQ-44]MCM8732111.1 SUF system Fe-S cluster assembly regulator [Hephaestia sp. MAHUQ-44]